MSACPHCGAALEGLGTFCHGCRRYSEGYGPVVLTLPLPPSVNAMWRVVARTKGMAAARRKQQQGGDPLGEVGAFATLVLSREGRAYKATAQQWLAAQKVRRLGGPIALTATFYFARRGSDLDNRLKPLLDVLQGAAFDNDRQVSYLAAWRRIDRERPRVVVRLEASDGPSDPFADEPIFSFHLGF